MREKKLLPLFLWLNVALASCFVCYILVSSGSQPAVTPTTFRPMLALTGSIAGATSIVAAVPHGLPLAKGDASTTNEVADPASFAGATNETAAPVLRQTKVGWEQLDKPEYD